MTYSAGWVVLHDNEQYGVWNATRDASAVFRGRFGALLIFELSFLGWNLLALASVYLCFLLGMLGLTVIGGGLGTAVMAVSLIAALCVGLVVGSFVNSYYRPRSSPCSIISRLPSRSRCTSTGSRPALPRRLNPKPRRRRTALRTSRMTKHKNKREHPA